jgi:hypothetical protein
MLPLTTTQDKVFKNGKNDGRLVVFDIPSVK